MHKLEVTSVSKHKLAVAVFVGKTPDRVINTSDIDVFSINVLDVDVVFVKISDIELF